MGCPRTFCRHCDEEMIHRDNRRFYESASCLGQIIYREGPLALTFGDVDGVARKRLTDGTQLLRLIEHKTPTQRVNQPQHHTLSLLDDVVRHCVECTRASQMRLHPHSGLFFVRGELGAATTSRRETTFIGPQKIVRASDGASIEVADHEAFFRFLDPEDLRRRGKAA